MDDVRPRSRAPGPDLVGRTADLDVVGSFLTRPADAGGALLLTGDPGVGKSVLLQEACRTAAASGVRLLRASGVQFEAKVSFAGLNQLLLPLHDRLGGLPALHRRALAVALGVGSGPDAGRLVVSAAALALLRAAAADGPVLVAVDDLQWLDHASARVLGFVARRLEGSGIGFLGAVRTDPGSFLLRAGLPRHEVPPLDAAAAADLLGSRFPGLAPAVHRRVVSAAQGNPLALLELPLTMTEGQRRAAEPLPRSLTLSAPLQELFAERVRGLPADTRRLLLLAALDGTGDLGPLRAASSGDGWLDGLAPAERAGVVRVDPDAGRIAFRHPLTGAAVVELATSGERRRAHAVLAGLLPEDPERRAWHLAEAVVGPDEPAAALLEVAAHLAVHKGDAVRAVRALLRAADLSPRGADRARRLAEAAYVGADVAGRLHSVPDLLGEARRADPGTEGSLHAAVAAAHHLLNGEGDVDTAHLVLVRGIDGALAHGRSGAPVEEALHTLMAVCHFSGRPEPWRAFEGALDRLGPGVPPLLAVSGRVYGDPAGATPADLERLDALVATVDEEVDPVRIVRVAIAAFYVDRLAGCRRALWRVVRDGRDGGAATSAVSALMMLCHDAYREGRWDEAARAAEEGVAWGERLGYRLVALPGLYCLALLAAARGDEEATRSLTGEMVAWAAPRGVTMLEHFAGRARALAALGRGDYDEALRLGAAISPPGRLARHVPVALWTARDLVEAAARSGHPEEAAAHVAAVQRTAVVSRSPRLALLAAGAAALTASGEEAGALHREALALPGAARFPFERARVQLSHGEHLRRTRAAHAARVELTAALETFEHLGARPWAARAAQELHAGGHGGRPVRDRSWTTLTAQEREIASLAASGLSNKQIGTRLHLSPRTVSGHLYRVFPKLGVSTRAALRDALGPPPAAGSGRMTRDEGRAAP
ncbi:regulatory protein, luxR family [Geodermatophilus telluris]|uniref:Regulatory protein, luxR family n=1 Tax=Geodermatophilus telluris TaxID=1190417 RepID=A0A1G6TN33_9ACTN|nr:LuxR family transcriptional regulator [Geodermatophilus telluris]SDD30284.1 regulatory protein, luxR family [Geodermatophilus telluris]